MIAALTGIPALVNANGPVTYVVQPGDTLYDIAEKFGVPVMAVADENRIEDPSFIRIGQELRISTPAALPAPAAVNSPAAGSTPAPMPASARYVVEPGDTLSDIALRAGVPVASILALNSLESADLLFVGQVLQLPDSSADPSLAPSVTPVPPTAAPPTMAPATATTQATATTKPTETRVPATATKPAATTGPTTTYTILPGDTLYGVGQRYGTTAQTLLALNNIERAESLRVGQVILVPANPTAVPQVQAATPTSPPTVTPPPPTATIVPPTATRPPATPTAEAPSATPTIRPSATTTAIATASPAARTATPNQTPTPIKRPSGVKVPGAPAIDWPVVGPISQYFGENGHGGLDIEQPLGRPVRAAADGVVSFAVKGGDGRGIYVTLSHGGGWETEYQHLSKFTVNPGDRVRKGQIIGEIGLTGMTTGPHSHLEFRLAGKKLDPLLYLP